MATPLVFVYGTLRRLHGGELHALLRHHARFEGEGSVQAQLFNLGDYPGLVHSANPSDRVLGEVYRLEPSHLSETLEQMDGYEGIGPSYPVPPEYRREVVAVQLAEGSVADAWVYVFNGEPLGCPPIPSGDYMEWRASH